VLLEFGFVGRLAHLRIIDAARVQGIPSRDVGFAGDLLARRLRVGLVPGILQQRDAGEEARDLLQMKSDTSSHSSGRTVQVLETLWCRSGEREPESPPGMTQLVCTSFTSSRNWVAVRSLRRMAFFGASTGKVITSSVSGL
jgi:hypothetical protein